jgi:hypothetical protein
MTSARRSRMQTKTRVRTYDRLLGDEKAGIAWLLRVLRNGLARLTMPDFVALSKKGTIAANCP